MSTIEVSNVMSQPEPSQIVSAKRRVSSALDKIFRKKSSIGFSSTAFTSSIPHTHIDALTDDDLLTGHSNGSDSGPDDDAMTLWSSMEGNTYIHSMFGNQPHLNNLSPELVWVFSYKRKFGCLGDASDVMYIGDGRSLVVDMIGNRVLHFDKRGISSIAYSTEDMIEPWAVAVNTEDVIHVTARKTKCVTRFLKNGESITPIKNVNFTTPSGVAIGKNDQMFVSDVTTNLLTAHETDGTFISTIGSSMSPIQHLDRPRYVTVDNSNNIIVSDSGNHSIKVFDSEGNFVHKIGERGKGEGQLKFPYGVCTDTSDNIIVADHYNDRVSFFSKSGQFIRHLVTSLDGLNHPQGVYLTSNFRLLVTHGGLKAHEVLVYDLRSSQLSEKEVFV
ncbi:E3 ubiquitin-protein ligase TRIM71-like [Pecten maximus]|uniref:E3 ubiquitin-protein ligase TRIM71-like n=1 Tax=Pecten maximus TaxID=6579 RepID=UPI001458A418|nr:E3 ubiquitin-protein ligase TRIM71-like [Pecten maximus]